MASLWIRSGYDMKDKVSAETYQVGAHFKALIKAILVAPLKSYERFFRISSSPAGLCMRSALLVAKSTKSILHYAKASVNLRSQGI